jgi:glycosyltransferase involved in cell wall biosynthesis
LRRGGAEKQTVYIARALHNAGIDLRFFYLGRGGHYESVLRELGVPVRQIFHPNQPWKILAGLIKALRSLRPEMVLVNQFGDLRYGAVAGRCCKALILAGVRSDGWYELRSHGGLTRLMLRLAHGFVANSHRARQTLVSQGVESQKMEVLPNVIDLREFDARSALGFSDPLPPGRILVAAVGSLHPCKRFDRFLEALALARRSEPALAGVIAGADGGARAALEERAKALGLTSSDLIFLGECERVPALLTQVAMLVLSSDYEGFPNVILEAMAARLPVITTPAGDASLIVRHGQTGYVVQPEDTPGMGAFMVRLAQSSSLRMEMGEAGRQRVEQEFTYESLSNLVIRILHAFATQHRRTAVCEMLKRDFPAPKVAALPGTMLVEAPLA